MQLPDVKTGPILHGDKLGRMIGLLGLGFCQAWTSSWSSAYILFPLRDAAATTALRTAGKLSLVATIISLVLFALTAKKVTPLHARRASFVGFPLLVVVGSILMMLAGWGIIDSKLGLYSGGVISGVGMAGLLLLSAEAYGPLGLRRASVWVSASYALSVAVYFLVNSLQTIPAAMLILCLPVISAALLRLVLKDSPQALLPSEERVSALFAFPWRFLIGAAVYSVVFGVSIGLLRVEGSVSSEFFSRLATGVVALLILLGALWFSRDLDLGFTYRAILPLMVAGFLLLPFLGTGKLVFARVVFSAGYACLVISMWITMCDLASRLKVPVVPMFGWGQAMVSSSVLVGSLVGENLSVGVFQSLSRQLPLVSSAAILLLVVTSTLLLNERDVLTVWGRLTNTQFDTGRAAIERDLGERMSAEYALSQRERDVMLLIIQGQDAAAIQKSLFIAAGTLKAHMHNIYVKTGVHGRKELISLVSRHAQELNR